MKGALRTDERGDGTVMTTMCAFCGQAMDSARAATVVADPPSNGDGTQTLYCHGGCLAEHVHPSVPLHPGIFDG